MRIEILNKTKKELKIKIDGENHTFCNIVQKALLRDKRVDLAGYDIPHPLIASPIIYLRTKASKPEIVLLNAVEKVQKDTETFRVAFDKALEEWKS